MNKSLQLFCPARPRDFKGKRWLKIVLRTLHLLGVAGVSGGILLNVPITSWAGYLHITLFSGIAFLVLELWTNAIFLIQLRGLIIAIKLLLLTLLYSYPQYSSIVLVVIILSSIVSHAPGNFRYFSLLHGRRVDALS
jgi:hypothetical protein